LMSSSWNPTRTVGSIPVIGSDTFKVMGGVVERPLP
jgi:hypothetical protein